MTEKYGYYLLATAFFLIFFIRSGRYLDSAGLGIACAYIVIFIVIHFKPVSIIHKNDFDGANVMLNAKESENE